MTDQRNGSPGRRAEDMGKPDWNRYARRVQRLYRLIVVVLVLVGLFTIIGVATFVQVKKETNRRVDIAKQNQRILKSVEEQQAQLADCLNPAGECAKRSQANSRKLSTAISYCAATLPPDTTVAATVQCVVGVLNGGAVK